MDSNKYFRKVEGARTVLAGRLIDFVPAPKASAKGWNYGTTSTPQTGAGNALETIGCIHCGASYGHKIKCPVFYSHAVLPQESLPLSEADIALLKEMKISL